MYPFSTTLNTVKVLFKKMKCNPRFHSNDLVFFTLMYQNEMLLQICEEQGYSFHSES